MPGSAGEAPESDGYAAVQLGFGAVKARNARKAAPGHAKKAGLDSAPDTLREFKVGADQAFEVGQNLTVEQFAAGERVKVVGDTKGRGFQGVVRRQASAAVPLRTATRRCAIQARSARARTLRASSRARRCQARMGDTQHTVRNLRVEKIDAERNLIYVRGGVPGARNSLVLIKKM